MKAFELKGTAGNVEYQDLIDTNLCNIDSLLDTRSELERMWRTLLEEERRIKTESQRLID